jgi:hypothetical protein
MASSMCYLKTLTGPPKKNCRRSMNSLSQKKKHSPPPEIKWSTPKQEKGFRSGVAKGAPNQTFRHPPPLGIGNILKNVEKAFFQY